MIHRTRHAEIAALTECLARTPGQLIPIDQDGEDAPLFSAGGPLISTAPGPAEGAIRLAGGRIVSWKDGSSGGDSSEVWVWDDQLRIVQILQDVHEHFSRMGEGSVAPNLFPLPRGGFLSWAADHLVRIWDDDGKMVGSFERDPGAIKVGSDDARLGSYNFSGTLLSNGRICFWGGEDRTLQLWSRDEVPIRPPRLLQDHMAIWHVVALANGRFLTSAYHKDRWRLTLWNDDGTALKSPEGGIDGALSLDGDAVLLWKGTDLCALDGNGSLTAIFTGHDGPVKGALVLKSGRVCSWARDDDMLRLWSRDGQLLGTQHTHCRGGALALDNGCFVTYPTLGGEVGVRHGYGGVLALWDPDGRPLSSWKAHRDVFEVQGALKLPDGRFVSWLDEKLRVWHEDGREAITLDGHGAAVTGALVTSRGHLLSWSKDGTLRLWDLDPEISEHRPNQRHGRAVEAAFSPSSGRLLS